jgi:hypothetical protein
MLLAVFWIFSEEALQGLHDVAVMRMPSEDEPLFVGPG